MELVGHKKQRVWLDKIFSKETLPNVLLFTGEPDIGKLTATKDFVASWISKTTGQPKESILTELDSNSLRDVTLYAPQGRTFSVEEVRDLRKLAYQPPFNSPLKWIVLNNIEKMTKEAANALLKVLEDTPVKTKFILISDDETKLLPTVVGRAFKLEFSPLAEGEIQDFLEAEGVDEQTAYTAASLSEGSLLRAQQSVENQDYVRLMKTICSWFEEWYSSPLHELWGSIDEVFKEFDRVLVYRMMLSVVAEMWMIYEGGEIRNPYFNREKMPKACKGLARKGFQYINERLKDLRSINAALNDNSQVKSLFLELRPVR